METININELIDLSLNLIFYFTIGSFGAFFKVIYESLTTENYKIRIGKIIIGGGTTAILCAGLNYNLLHQYSLGTRFMVASIMGILGFEIFGKIKNIEGLKDFINDIIDVTRASRGERIETRTPPPERSVKDTEDYKERKHVDDVSADERTKDPPPEGT